MEGEVSLPTVVHIGFPKTGTTTLQNHLFAQHPQILYPGKPYEDSHLKEMINRLVMQESTVYDSSGLKEYIKKYLARAAGKEKKVFLISEETLVSAAKVRDKGVVALRIKDVFAPCKILVTIRNQMEAVKSGYIGGGRFLINAPSKYKNMIISFTDWLEICEKMYHGDFVNNVVYFNTIEYYAGLLGKENICVLLFEDFVQNKHEFIEKLCQFLGIDFTASWDLIQDAHDNKRLSQADFQMESLQSKLGFLGNFKPLAKLFSGARKIFASHKRTKVDIPEEWQQRLRDFYKEGNRKLRENYQLPLEKYNYPL